VNFEGDKLILIIIGKEIRRVGLTSIEIEHGLVNGAERVGRCHEYDVCILQRKRVGGEKHRSLKNVV
jgi:hypothetical protein